MKYTFVNLAGILLFLALALSIVLVSFPFIEKALYSQGYYEGRADEQISSEGRIVTKIITSEVPLSPPQLIPLLKDGGEEVPGELARQRRSSRRTYAREQEEEGLPEGEPEEDTGNSSGGEGNAAQALLPPPEFTVAFIGDTGYGGNFRAVLELIRDERADLVLHAGDLGYDESNPETPQRWINVVNDVLGEGFPYFFSMGNHDEGHWESTAEHIGYRELLQQRFDAMNVEYTGAPEQLGARTSFLFQNIQIVLTAPGEDEQWSGLLPWHFIEQELENSQAAWSICLWHKNMEAMQVGGKRDETWWEVYETCREQGAIIATAHEHSYARTHVLSDMSEQTVADSTSPYTLREGQTFAFHSGLGGNSVRDQERCLPATPPYGCNGEWGAIYTESQNAAYGALFIEFNIDGNPRRARGYFKNIRGEVIDEFELINEREVQGGSGEEPSPEIPPAGFVYADGTRLLLDGEPYQFLGVNVYGAANDRAMSFACGPAANNGRAPEEYLNAMFTEMENMGVNAVRFWAFPSFALRDDETLDFSAIDRVIRQAREHNIKVIPVLENQWNHCPGSIHKYNDWYASGYRAPYGEYPLSFVEYVDAIVARYGDEPTVLMWQIMNEAQSEDRNGVDDPESLRRFAEALSARIKELDQNHLVSLGTIGRGQAGIDNENFALLHQLEAIDVVEAHDYRHEEEAWPASNFHSIDRAYRIAQELGKPFFIGEAGICRDNLLPGGRPDCDVQFSREERAALFDAKLNAALVEREVAGYLLWEWDNPPVDFGREECRRHCFTVLDPLVEVLRVYGGRI